MSFKIDLKIFRDILTAPAGLAFVLFTARPEKIRGSSRTGEGVKALPARYSTRPGTHCDLFWQGRPSYSRGCGRLWICRCSRHSVLEGLGALGYTSGRERPTIPAPPALYHLLWTAAPSARPRSLSPVAVNVRVVPGALPVLPPVPPPHIIFFAVYQRMI